MRLSEFPAEDSPVESLEKSGIDTARGLENCARDEEFYLSILKEYVNSSDEKKAELAKSIEAGGSQEL